MKPVAWQWLDTATFKARLPERAVLTEWRPLYANTLDEATRYIAAMQKRLDEEQIVASHSKRLAMELECLLLDSNSSSFWNSAHEALRQYQEDLDRIYRVDAEENNKDDA